MECYVGLDVSLKQTSICVVSRTGSVVREGVVDSDPAAIAAFVRLKAPGAIRVGLETVQTRGAASIGTTRKLGGPATSPMVPARCGAWPTASCAGFQ